MKYMPLTHGKGVFEKRTKHAKACWSNMSLRYRTRKGKFVTIPPFTLQGFQTWCMRWVTARVEGESGFSGVSPILRDRGSCSLEDVCIVLGIRHDDHMILGVFSSIRKHGNG